ncbi:hypothetical protein M5K25_020567 [Dendrobium thyrsiflorum]|uniref:Pectinesterase inhibitor domain-containing protein n=1 Tax=Dendrobium thyrsiflorum TaxID=117978 RepID=A0ABD0UAA0_DENTH
MDLHLHTTCSPASPMAGTYCRARLPRGATKSLPALFKPSTRNLRFSPSSIFLLCLPNHKAEIDRSQPAMPSFSSYGIISEQDQLGSSRRSSHKRLAIIALSSIVLIAVITVAILESNHGSDSGPPNPNTATASAADSSLRTSIKSLCSTTLYPDSCYASLAPVVTNSSSLEPAVLFRFAVQAAKDAIFTSAKLFDDPNLKQGIKSLSIAAISDCKQLLSLAAAHIEDCTTSATNFSSESFVDDLKTWLSAAITDQDTCLDGLGNDLGVNIAGAMKNSTEITSNSLSILNQIADFVGSVKLRRRRRLMSWMSDGDRRLLKSSSDLKYNANVVVAKDGSAKYKTITAALAEVPTQSSKKFVIYVKKGVYYENVRVELNMWNVVIVGDGMDATVVSGRLNFVDGTPTFSSATFAVFGKGFIAIEMAFQNTAGAIKQQAVAVLASADLSTIAGVINPAGWLPWLGTGTSVPDTIFYSEYQNYGPGSSLKNRVKWKGLQAMNAKQAGKFTVHGLIKGDSWIPKTGIPYSSGL